MRDTVRVERPKTAQLLKDIGRRIAEVRRARGVTQAVLAEQLDVTSRYVQSVEAGKENLTVASLAVFAALLDVSVAELFEAPSSRARRGPGRPRGT